MSGSERVSALKRRVARLQCGKAEDRCGDGTRMKRLPPNVALHRRTPEFTERSIPDGLRRSHRTKAAVWGRIVVLEGRLRYRILASPVEEVILDAGNPGVVEPEVEHEPLGHARFFVEFHR